MLVLEYGFMFPGLFMEPRKPKILEFILDNILIIGIITFSIIVFIAIVKYIEYRDTKNEESK